MLVLSAGFLCAVALFGQERPPQRRDPKPDYPPSYQVHISPTTKTEDGTSTTIAPDYWIARGFELKAVIASVYQVDPSRLDFPLSLDDAKRYDFALVLPKPESE